MFLREAEMVLYSKSLWKMSKTDLKALVQQSYRVVDVTTADKNTLVMMLVESHFGRKLASKLVDLV